MEGGVVAHEAVVRDEGDEQGVDCDEEERG